MSGGGWSSGLTREVIRQRARDRGTEGNNSTWVAFMAVMQKLVIILLETFPKDLVKDAVIALRYMLPYDTMVMHWY